MFVIKAWEFKQCFTRRTDDPHGKMKIDIKKEIIHLNHLRNCYISNNIAREKLLTVEIRSRAKHG